ncbi:MAG: hypothetical protein GWN86_06910 [Desulfobacterales bacterium]|nr:hypothetical protein [Desulfobacterales bacterium]
MNKTGIRQEEEEYPVLYDVVDGFTYWVRLDKFPNLEAAEAELQELIKRGPNGVDRKDSA